MPYSQITEVLSIHYARAPRASSCWRSPPSRSHKHPSTNSVGHALLAILEPRRTSADLEARPSSCRVGVSPHHGRPLGATSKGRPREDAASVSLRAALAIAGWLQAATYPACLSVRVRTLLHSSLLLYTGFCPLDTNLQRVRASMLSCGKEDRPLSVRHARVGEAASSLLCERDSKASQPTALDSVPSLRSHVFRLR